MAVVYRGWVFRVEKIRNRISGSDEFRITKPDVATVIPMLDSRTLLFERHYSSAIGRYLLERPAGHIDRGEAPARAARRELLEETGYRARSMEPAYRAYMAPGLLSDRMHFFVARGLVRTRPPTDKHEKTGLVRLGIDRAYGHVRDGKITDGKSIIGVLYCIAEKKDRDGPKRSASDMRHVY